jgi:hypothetical protein
MFEEIIITVDTFLRGFMLSQLWEKLSESEPLIVLLRWHFSNICSKFPFQDMIL